MCFCGNIEQKPYKILFLGNSYTYNHNLPIQVKELIEENHKELLVEVKALTPGGAKLKNHLDSSFTTEMIRNGNWNVIILQGHSLEPLKNPESFTSSATELIGVSKESGAQVYLFETWSRAEGDSVYSEAWSGQSPEMMQQKLNEIYHRVALETNVTVIPIGSLWQKEMREKKDIQLYSDDGSHPSQIGTELTASVIYQYITSNLP